MKLINRFIVALIFIVSMAGTALGQCYIDNKSFQYGEKITYEIYYNWAFIWLNAGEVSFQINKKMIDERIVYHFDSYGTTHKEYDWFFKVRDHFQSWVDSATFKPLYFHRYSDEGGYFVNNKYRFDHKNKRIYSFTESSRRPYKEDTLEMRECLFDVLSMIYYSRNIDFSNYEIDARIPITLVIDNEIFDLYVRYLGEERIKTKNGEVFDCIKFRPLLVEGTIFDEGEHMTVWVTNDDNKIPVLVEAKILVGSIKAYLNTYEGNRFPVIPVKE